MWWPNHIVSMHVSRIAKNIVCYVWKTLQDCISVYMLWRFEMWENRFNSHTIITAWWRLSLSRYILLLSHLLEYMLAIIFKSIFDLFAFDFSLHIFLFKHIIQGLIRERKEIPNDIWHSNFVIPKHTNVIDITLLLCWNIQMSYMIGGQQWWDSY